MNNKTILIVAIVFVLVIALIYWQYTKKQLELKEREIALAASQSSTAPSTDTKLSTAITSGTNLINTFQNIFGGLGGGNIEPVDSRDVEPIPTSGSTRTLITTIN